jgi:hypothetical protein
MRSHRAHIFVEMKAGHGAKNAYRDCGEPSWLSSMKSSNHSLVFEDDGLVPTIPAVSGLQGRDRRRQRASRRTIEGLFA